ncbi:thiolase family protein [Noviherbaspirillum pedocola]|uniref:Thiolase family protein n=1 Tax=Noviherbaspirillum pedocola TaxID=2801341 RepID=A0A934T0N3_9BURK|nr:thiolase family protein [Noviherbaspirillum pedocola]MBK4738531.1 thiolase family protein [Noviherbaspirillum pedocola]
MKQHDFGIAGYAEIPNRFKTGRSAYDLAGEALAALAQSTGIRIEDIDGLSVTAALSEGTNPFYAAYMCEALGITPTWLHLSGIGGCSALSGIMRAIAAVRDGDCRIAVVLSADAPSTAYRADFGAQRPEFQEPQAAARPPAAFGLLMSRYAHQYGLDEKALAKVAMVQRDHAVLNDNALPKLRKPLSMDEYLGSRTIADPLRILDSVMFCDGANAFLVTSRSEAKNLGLSGFAVPLAYAELTNFNGRDPLPDITCNGFSDVGGRLFQKAGMKPADIRMFQPYDDFTIAVQMQCEALGFCETGKGARFILDTDLSFDGKLPLNTGGGQISAGQPGLAGGGLNLAEAVRQLFGQAGARQVSDPSNALVTGIGVIPYGRNWSTSAAMILEASQ